MTTRRRHLPALALLVLLAACGGKDKNKAPQAPEAGYVVLTTQTVPLEIVLAGRTNAYETSDVRPQVSGLIKARHFVEGSIVHQGQTLYEIDPSLYRAAVAQAQANLANAVATPRRRRRQGRPLQAARRHRGGLQAGLHRRRRRRPAGRRQRAADAGRAADRPDQPALQPACRRRSPAASAARWRPPAPWSPAARPTPWPRSRASIRSMSTSNSPAPTWWR
ncbi:MAG: biotin/lipoyl-binding protein [Caulobacteraceae bacterium]